LQHAPEDLGGLQRDVGYIDAFRFDGAVTQRLSTVLRTAGKSQSQISHQLSPSIGKHCCVSKLYRSRHAVKQSKRIACVAGMRSRVGMRLHERKTDSSSVKKNCRAFSMCVVREGPS
jgi:hypothetical protein